MSEHFEFDFASVRIHDDSRASESARAVGALAYTVGSDIVFAAGNYSPTSASGARLLAHELAHVVQQVDPVQVVVPGHPPRGDMVMSNPADGAERQAAEVATTVTQPMPGRHPEGVRWRVTYRDNWPQHPKYYSER